LTRLVVLTLVAAGAAYGLAAAPVPFFDRAEPREALTVRAVLDGHGLALPRRDGVEMPSKPPLFHWLAALAVSTGVRPEELAMRLPSVVCAAAAVAVTAGAAAARYGTMAGVLAAVVLGTGFEWFRAATQARVDMTLAFCMVTTMLAWLAGVARPGGRWLVRLGWLGAAAGVLAKGPVGLVLPGLVVGMAALAAREPGRVRRLADAPGAALATALIAIWLVAAWWSGGTAFLARQLVHENLERALGGEEAPHAHSVFYYGPALLGSFFPWTLALPAAALRVWRRPAPADRPLLVWIATVFVFYSLASGKRSVYLLPLLPPLAMLTGAGLAAWLAEPPRAAARLCLGTGVAVLVAGAVVLAFGAEGPLAELITPHLHRSDRDAVPLVLDFVAAERPGIAFWVAALAAPLAAILARAGGVRGGVVALAAGGLGWTTGLTAFVTYPLGVATSPRPVVERVLAAVGPDGLVCRVGGLDYGVRYYLGRPLPPCDRAASRFVLRAAGEPPLAGCQPIGGVDERRRTAGPRLELDECAPENG
jgi:4-amino-4-deoxy-L-arabinose transferase-like glycosyltransferase